jgi:hypothetical protein
MRLILVLCLLYTAVSNAMDIERKPLPAVFYQRIIAPLIPEVLELTRLPLPPDPPVIYLSTRQTIQGLYCRDEYKNCAVAAVTDDKTGEITLSQELLSLNTITVSVIFHELVHWAQVKNHMFEDEADCAHWAKSEMHAYTAQSRFLIIHTGHGLTVPNLLEQCR